MARKPNSAPPKRVGRPSLYSEDLATRICELVSQCRPIHQIAGTDGIPDEATIYRWLEDERKLEFREMYARARQRAAERFAWQIIDIIDRLATRQVAPDVARVQIDGLKWAAAKFAPRVYGESMRHVHSRLDGFDWSSASEEQLRAIAAGKVPE